MIIVDYGMGNLRSIQKACESVGGKAIVSSDPDDAARADKIILPGVGAFRDAIAALQNNGMDRVLTNHARAGKPLLGICLGYQLLFDKSYEDGEYAGLGLVKGLVKPLRAHGRKVPHTGWNTLVVQKDSAYKNTLNGKCMYFVHSFAATDCNEKDILATTEYGETVTAAVEHDNIVGFQFHPEKSGASGLALLKTFIERKI